MTEKKNTKIAEKAAENITVSYKSLSNLKKDLSKLHSSEIKELKKSQGVITAKINPLGSRINKNIPKNPVTSISDIIIITL